MDRSRTPAVPGAKSELRALEPDECWAFLAEAPIGRLGVVTLNGTVLILPVNFAIEHHTIVFRTAPGASLDHLARGPVTFQADGIDLGRRRGWSVLVHGPAMVDPDPADHDAAPMPWAGGHRRAVVRIRADRITGRFVGPSSTDWDPQGYL